MRKWAVLLLALGSTVPALAAENLSIEQMEELLVRLHGKADAKVAKELAGVELTERVSGARLARWEKENPGERTREVLTELADLSAFHKAPRGDVASDPAPDGETQQRILGLAVEYVRSTIPRLPNFYATRETRHYESDPEHTANIGETQNSEITIDQMTEQHLYGGARTLHRAGAYSRTVTFRDGREVPRSTTAEENKENPATIGLTTVGEFGPILVIVLTDAIHSKVEWQRWEPGNGGSLCVFRYAVRENQSHYKVKLPLGTNIEDFHPAYHGEIEIDPATGAILRISAVVDMPYRYEQMQAEMMVEYALVEIGERRYICPVKGVAISSVPEATPTTLGNMGVAYETQLNDVTFKNYHVFRTESKIVSDGSGKPANDAVPPSVPQQ